jgi:hypothetical protein
MINIDGLGRLRTAAPSKTLRSGGAGRSDFARLVGESSARTNTGLAASVGGIEALLAAQEAGDGTQGRSRGKARAEALLDSLDELRSDILAGGVSPGRLRAIADLVATQRGEVSDPKLAEILDEIDLRAQVELAKLGLGGA